MGQEIPINDRIPHGIPYKDFWEAVQLVDCTFTPNDKYKSKSGFDVLSANKEAVIDGYYAPYMDKIISITFGTLSELLEIIRGQRDASWLSKRKLIEHHLQITTNPTDTHIDIEGEETRLD